MRLPVYERRAGVQQLSMPQVQPNPQVSDNGETAAKTLHGVFTRIQEIQDGMDDARTLELFNRFKQDSQEYHENPDRGVYNTRFGFQASGVYKDADEWLRRKGEDYARQLPSRRAQFNFRKMVREHIQQRGMQNSRFEAEQMRRYQQETADATIKERLNYAETHWDDNTAIAQVRRDIQQALELKMRGSGKEAFTAAWADVEDEIGIRRIRQALVRHPLQALDMFTNDDIHLKAETRAKLVHSLKDQTEIYRLHADIQAYAQQYSPQNAAELRKILDDRFDLQEAEKIFQGVIRYWSLNNYQKQAQEQAEQETRKKNENEILGKWNMYISGETDVMPDLQELNRRAMRGEISYSFVHSMLTQVLHKQNADKAAQAKEEKLQKDIERWSAENRGVFLTNEQMEQAVTSGYWTLEDARHHENARYEFTHRQEQENNKRLDDNKQNFIDRFLDGKLTEEMLTDARQRHILRPSDTDTIRGYLRTEQQRLEAEQKRNTQEAERLKKKAQEQYQGAVRVVIGMGGRISKESATKLYDAEKIDQSFLQWLYGQEEQREREEAAAKKEQAKAQAETDKEAWKKNLDLVAQTYAMAHFKDEGAGLRKISSQEFMPELSTEQREHLIQQFNLHSRAINLEAKNYKDRHEEFQKKMHEERMRLYEVHFNTREEIAQAYKSIQALYDEPDGLDPQFYNEEKAILDRKSREIDKTQAEADKKKKAADEAAHKQKIDQWGLEIYNLYKDRGKGDALSYIDRVNIDPDTRQKLHARVSTLFDDESQSVKDKRERLHQAHEEIYSGMVAEILGQSLTNEQIAQKKQEFIDMRKSGGLEENRYNSLISILNEQERINNQATKLKRKQDDFDTARDLAQKYGLSGQHDGREYITRTYTDHEQHQNIMSAYDGFIRDLQSAQTAKDKALSERQRKTYEDIVTEINRSAQPYDSQKLFQLEQSEGITHEHAEKIRILNGTLATRQGYRTLFEKNNTNGFNSMGYSQQQAMISDYLGISQDQRATNVAAYLDRAAQGKITKSEIDWAESTGRIAPDDADNLRNFNANFDRNQKAELNRRRREMMNAIMDLYKGDRKKSHIWNNASVDFLTQTALLDLKSPNFAETVDKIIEGIMTPIMDDFSQAKTLTSYEYGIFGKQVPTNAGTRYNAIQDWMNNTTTQTQQPHMYYQNAQGNISTLYSSESTQSADTPAPVPEIRTPKIQQQEAPQGFWGKVGHAAKNALDAVVDFVGEPYMPDNLYAPPAVPPAAQNVSPPPSKPYNLSLAMVNGATITGRFSDWRAYRGGQHNGIDAAAKEGTPIKWTNVGFPVTVAKVNTKTPAKGAGNSITLTGDDAQGNHYEFIIGHMQNGSARLNVGDVLLPGDVIGGVGNTGMTSDREKGGITAWYEGKNSGYHMDLKVKVNGKYIDPEKFFVAPEAQKSYVGPTRENARNFSNWQPRMVAPPIVSTDQQIQEKMMQALREFYSQKSLDQTLGLNDPLFSDISGDILNPNYSAGGSWF